MMTLTNLGNHAVLLPKKRIAKSNMRGLLAVQLPQHLKGTRKLPGR